MTPAPAPIVPSYGAGNLTGIVPALMAPPGERPSWIPEPALDAEQVVLLVLDGLGWEQLTVRPALTPQLHSLAGGPVTSVVPTTTACALTSLVVGAPPAAHGIVGYRVAVEGPTGTEVMNVLKWKTVSGDARPFVDPLAFQAVAPFGGREVPVVSRASFAGTGFTVAHQHGARQVGWYETSGLAVDVRAEIEAGQRFVYAYYDGVDRVAHVYGFDPHYDAEVSAADRLVGDVLAVLPPEGALVVTADHGQVEVGRRVIELDRNLLRYVSLVSGEPRFRWLHCAERGPAAPGRLAERCRELYGDDAWVLTYDEVADQGWLGGPVTPEVRSRLGDVAVVPFEPVAYLEPGEGAESRLVCRHGSLTPDEMFVPLLAARGKLSG